MITQDYRPQRFSEVLSQDLPKKVLAAIAKAPEGKPQSLTLSGPFGCGKTTLARIFARALNYPDSKGDVSPDCPFSGKDLEKTGVYTEYDSTVVGKVDNIRNIRDTFQFSTNGMKKVILFDEAQVISKEAQSSLLKTTEEAPKDVFFIFATTDPDDLLPPLRSRTLELELTVAPRSVMRRRVDFLCHELSVDADERVRELIVDRSQGHFRNCDMLFDLYQILGEDFVSSVSSVKNHYAKFIALAMIDEREEAKIIMEHLRMKPLAELRVDFDGFMVDMANVALGGKTDYLESLQPKGVKLMNLVKYYLSPWGPESFRNDRTFEMFMWSLYAVAKSLG